MHFHYISTAAEGIRCFYYDLRHSTMPECNECMRLLSLARPAPPLTDLDAALALDTSDELCLLFGIHERAYRLGRFAARCGGELHLRTGERFILTADRRLHSAGTEAAAYVNCAALLPQLLCNPEMRIYIGGSERHPAKASVELSVQAVVRDSIVCTVVRRYDCKPLRPHDRVHMPIKTYGDELSGEERDDIDMAIRYGAHAICVPVAGDAVFHKSVRDYVWARAAEQQVCRVHVWLSQQGGRVVEQAGQAFAEFVAETYDG